MLITFGVSAFGFATELYDNTILASTSYRTKTMCKGAVLNSRRDVFAAETAEILR